MPRLSIYTTKSLTELIDTYELCSTDLTNEHRDLAIATADLHTSYLEAYIRSNGKSVAEKNRDADWSTKDQYHEILQKRGGVNSLSTQREMLAAIINWKLAISAKVIESTTGTIYPVDFDKERLGRG